MSSSGKTAACKESYYKVHLEIRLLNCADSFVFIFGIVFQNCQVWFIIFWNIAFTYFIDSMLLFFVSFIEASLILWLLYRILLSILVYSAIKNGYCTPILIDVYRIYVADFKRNMIGPELFHNDIYESKHLHTIVLNMMFNNRWILVSLRD